MKKSNQSSINRKFKVCYFILRKDKKTGLTTKAELPVLQFISFITDAVFPDAETLESVINKTLPKYAHCELDCYSPAV